MGGTQRKGSKLRDLAEGLAHSSRHAGGAGGKDGVCRTPTWERRPLLTEPTGFNQSQTTRIPAELTQLNPRFQHVQKTLLTDGNSEMIFSFPRLNVNRDDGGLDRVPIHARGEGFRRSSPALPKPRGGPRLRTAVPRGSLRAGPWTARARSTLVPAQHREPQPCAAAHPTSIRSRSG